MPVVQQSAVDFINDPTATNALIVDVVTQYDTFWTYPQEIADYSVETQRELGLTGNGDDDTLGNMDEARVDTLLQQMRDAGLDVPDDLTADDLVNNQFIDSSIGLVNTEGLMKLTITAAIQARWGHRVDGLIHTHAWTVEATVEGPADAAS